MPFVESQRYLHRYPEDFRQRRRTSRAPVSHRRIEVADDFTCRPIIAEHESLKDIVILRRLICRKAKNAVWPTLGSGWVFRSLREDLLEDLLSEGVASEAEQADRPTPAQPGPIRTRTQPRLEFNTSERETCAHLADVTNQDAAQDRDSFHQYEGTDQQAEQLPQFFVSAGLERQTNCHADADEEERDQPGDEQETLRAKSHHDVSDLIGGIFIEEGLRWARYIDGARVGGSDMHDTSKERATRLTERNQSECHDMAVRRSTLKSTLLVSAAQASSSFGLSMRAEYLSLHQKKDTFPSEIKCCAGVLWRPG